MKVIQYFFLALLLISIRGVSAQDVSLRNYPWITEIYENLEYAMLEKVDPMPKLKISSDDSRMAYAIIQGIDSEIGIEEKTIQILETFGDRKRDAVAALLAHELIHVSHHEDRADLFLTNPYPGTEDHKTRVRLEMEADHHGILLAHRAGYDVADIFPEILEKLYDAYQYPDTLSGYPVLNHRRLNAEEMNSIKNNLQIFEAANYYSLLGLYESSIKLYQYINFEYPSPELYNNIGINYVLSVLPYLEPQTPDFVYPLQLEISSRLDFIHRSSSGGEREMAQKVSFMLGRARKALNEALRLDPRNAAAYINLACLDDIENNYDAAKGRINEALKYARGHDLYNAYLMKGITLAHSGDREGAFKAFGLAQDGEEPLIKEKARTNIDRMKEREETIQKIKGNPNWVLEKIDGKTLDQIADPRNAEQIFEISSQDPILDFGIQHFRSSRAFMLKKTVQEKKEWYFIQITDRDYQGASGAGVRIGDRQSRVFSAYGGKPETIKYTSQGKALIYKEHGGGFEPPHPN